MILKLKVYDPGIEGKRSLNWKYKILILKVTILELKIYDLYGRFVFEKPKIFKIEIFLRMIVFYANDRTLSVTIVDLQVRSSLLVMILILHMIVDFTFPDRIHFYRIPNFRKFYVFEFQNF